jgi:hypothetical protein
LWTHSSVERRLPTTGLILGKINLTPCPLENSNHSFSSFWVECINDAGNEKLNGISHITPHIHSGFANGIDCKPHIEKVQVWVLEYEISLQFFGFGGKVVRLILFA